MLVRCKDSKKMILRYFGPINIKWALTGMFKIVKVLSVHRFKQNQYPCASRPVQLFAVG